MPDTATTSQTQHLLDALRKWHADQAMNGVAAPWVYADEVRIGTGFGYNAAYYRKHNDKTFYPDSLLGATEQRIDAFALHTWPSKKGLRIAYEVKVSRADLKHELDDPEKCAAAMSLSNEFYLVVPRDLVVVLSTLPDEWGLIRIDDNGNRRIIKTAEYRDTPLPPYTFMLSLARNLQREATR